MLRYGRIAGQDNGQSLDEVLTAYMPGPKSFTGEDMVEIYCHAGQFTLNAIQDRICALGCRPAEPGEFSMRRFLNHGVDISKLEGAAEVVASKTDLAWRLSREHLLGAYGEHISNLRKKIVHLLAEIEADIDFPEEDSIGSIGRSLLDKRLDGIIGDLEHLAADYKMGKIIQDGYRVALMGPPNAGKSSLFNRLVRQNRALVTPVPGTTRDYISEWIDIKGLPVELFDTAGLRKARGQVERAGVVATRKIINRADLIIYIYDLSGKIPGSHQLKLRKNQQVIIALNKIDLLPGKRPNPKKRQSHFGKECDCCVISAKTGKGIKELISKIYSKSGVADLTESLVVTSQRHKIKIDRCLHHLHNIRRMIDQPTEIVSFELRQAANQIGEITGHVYTEEILDEIFANFCIGK
jgi:tRNA modification GTPase